MADRADLPEPDRVEGAPHPRETRMLFGQAEAEAQFLSVFGSDRLHHAWLLTGPKGIGKATLAWRIARFLLATPPLEDDGLFGAPQPPETLDIDPEHPVSRRILALSEPGLFHLRRGPNDQGTRLSDMIRVDQVRKLANFFHLSASDGGRRVVIVDAADELNPQAANALLKMLEEPPDRATLLLVSHQPARLLPTIRSRCRVLRLAPLSPKHMHQALEQAEARIPPDHAGALANLAEGSVGTALHLAAEDGLVLYGDLLSLLASLPKLDRPRLIALAESCSGKGKEARLALLMTLTDRLVARLARTGVTGKPPPDILKGEGAVLTRLAPDAASGRAWAEAIQTAGDRARHARVVNVDPAHLVTDLFLQLSKAASSAPA